MAKNIQPDESREFCPRFGKIAVDLGYVTPGQVKQALTEQLEDNLAGRPHRILGAIFFEHDWMTAGEVEAVVDRLLELSRKQEK